MVRNLAVAVDGSEESKAAFDVAVELARAFSNPLTIVSVVPPVTGSSVAALGLAWGATPAVQVPDDEREKFQREIVQRLKEEATHAGVKEVQAKVLDGIPALTLMDYASNESIDLLLMGARGRSGTARLFLGSVSSTVVAEASCPVLVVHLGRGTHAAAGPRSIQKVVVAVDGSAPSELGFRAGTDLARTLKVPLRIVTVAPQGLTEPRAPRPSPAAPPSPLAPFEGLVEGLRKEAESRQVEDVSTEVLRGSPVDAILTYVDEAPSTLLVVGSRGLTPARRLLLGSVSTALLHLAPCMVLVLKGKPGPAPTGRPRSKDAPSRPK
jgi:nucleotide-binding universal stress UspA family protein